METFTKDELELAVTQAIAEVTSKLDEKQTELDNIRASQSADEVQTQIDTAKAEAQQKVDEVNAALDVATNRANVAEQEVADIKAYLEAEKTAIDEATAFEDLKASRLEAIKEVASFDDSYINERLDDWAKFDEATFDTLVDTLAKANVKGEGEGEGDGSPKIVDGLPVETAVQHDRKSGTGSTLTSDVFSALNVKP